VDFNFPTEDLLPKKESGAISYLNKFPNYDGRGTVIAIFDSGVDPRAQGLQVTTDGKRKIIDCFDGSGAGDVTLVKVEVKDSTITGLSGRILKIPDSWNNPSGVYHIGLKSLYELYPGTLKERMMKEYKEKEWDPHHKSALAEAMRKLHTFEINHPTPTASEKLLKEELEMQIEMLNMLEKKYKNIGPCFDCVAFNDGEKWRACLDTSYKGNLSECQVLGVYRETFDIGILSESDQLSYTINVHDEGNILEIVTLCTSHGTHVASIAAANFPEDPAKNGVAPGAQIVSISIGDARLKSMETGTSLMRAMIRVLEMTHYKVDVINMSYGEHAHWAHSGRIGELMSEVVNKYGIIWVVSGSNNGPALTTIGTPPAIATSTLIGVGAYVSPEMMAAEYSLREKLPGMPYTWSSRGPALDGSMGISICAPGGAITSVPKFLLRGSQLMNGTSMSAPHVTGAIGLLVSGLKARNVPFSPFSVKRALEHTAKFLDGVEVFAQGHGLIQIDRAFDHMISNHHHPDRDVRFHVTIGNTLSHKGIYMRDTQTSKSKEFNINVEPFFLNNEDRDAASKIDFNLRLALTCNSSWVQIPKHFDLMFMLRGFSVKVDPSGLAPGVHYSCVKAYDSACPEKGAVFEVPITVVKPELMAQNEITFSKQHFASGDIQRRFIAVPKNATWAAVSIELENKKIEANNARFMVHALQMIPEQNCKSVEFQKFVDIHEKSHIPLAFAVKGGRILELCLAKWWASLGTVQITYTITFHGISSRTSSLNMHGAKGIMRLDLESSSINEEVAPVATLTHQVQSFRPSDSKILPLGCRDVIRPGRQIYELVLVYNFNVAKATEVTPDCALLSDTLYESEFESQLWMIHDSNKQYIAAGDAYPSHYSTKLEKGDYVLRLHVRHEKKDLLDKLQDMPVLISQKLSSSVSLDVYGTHNQALIQGKKLNGFTIHEGDHVPIYLSPLNSDKCCKTVNAGQYLAGTISYAKDELGKKVNTHPFTYTLVEPKKTTKTDKVETEKNKNNEEEMTEAVRDLKISWIKKLETPELRNAVYEELVKESPDYLPIYIARLQALESEKVMDWKTIFETANIALKFINVSELLEYSGLKSDNRADAAKIKSRMEKNKNYLLEILVMKGLALCEGYSRSYSEEDSDSASSMKEEILDVFNEITKFTEASDTKVSKFGANAALVQHHYGRALRLVYKQFEEKPTRDQETKIIEIFRQLKWNHCSAFFNRSLPLKYPSTYRSF